MSAAARTMDGAVREASGDDLHAEMRGVTRVYAGGVHALAATELRLRRGEFYSVVGPSGCGKSTLLDVLAGLSQPTERHGRCSKASRSPATCPTASASCSRRMRRFPWLTVADNIAFGLRRDRRRGSGDRARGVDHALRLMGLVDFADAYPAQLSGGMRQRVCIARTLVHAAAPDPARRAVRRARPADAAADGRRAAAAVARDRRDRAADHACARRGRDAVRPHRRDVGAARPHSSRSSRPAGRASAAAASSPSRRFGAITARLWRAARGIDEDDAAGRGAS